MTSAFLNRWIASLSETNRCKEQYPVCIREVYKAALKEFNDEEQGIARLKNPGEMLQFPEVTYPKNGQFLQVCYESSSMSFLIEVDLPIL